jgi:transcriptional regulator with XRE-family HTH domain
LLEVQTSRESQAVVLRRRAPHRARRLPAIRDESKDDSVVMDRRATFFSDLRSARQAKGVSLEQIAASTKINISLLKALENNDLSRWPKGLFGRSYLRDYLRAVGLPIESTVGDFIRLFPDVDDSSAPELARCDDPEPAPLALALTFGDDKPDRFAERGRRLCAATLDAAIVVIASATAAVTLSASFWTAATLMAIFYYSLGVAWLGHPFGAHWLIHRGPKRWRKSAAPTAAGSFVEKIRRLRERAANINLSTARDLARVPLHALLLRIRFLR